MFILFHNFYVQLKYRQLQTSIIDWELIQTVSKHMKDIFMKNPVQGNQQDPNSQVIHHTWTPNEVHFSLFFMANWIGIQPFLPNKYCWFHLLSQNKKKQTRPVIIGAVLYYHALTYVNQGHYLTFSLNRLVMFCLFWF